jgi:hypothetical protein
MRHESHAAYNWVPATPDFVFLFFLSQRPGAPEPRALRLKLSEHRQGFRIDIRCPVWQGGVAMSEGEKQFSAHPRSAKYKRAPKTEFLTVRSAAFNGDRLPGPCGPNKEMSEKS